MHCLPPPKAVDPLSSDRGRRPLVGEPFDCAPLAHHQQWGENDTTPPKRVYNLGPAYDGRQSGKTTELQ